MDCARTNSRIGDIPAWLESRGLPEESLRAVVMGLGIEIFGVLCARAEPAPARVRLCSLSTREFTLAMYAKLCCFMESCIARKGSEQLVVPGCDNDSEKVGRTEVLQVKVEDGYLVDPEEEGSYTEDWRQVELIRKSSYTSGSQSFTTETPLKRNQPTSTDKKLILRVDFIMDKWTLQQRALIVELYFRNGCSVVCAQREFRRARGVRIAPTDKAIRRWVTAF
uniref:uncharacterized protein isoform X2 n=1 Tax=Myxine glutinosa TaxID=7769 RepID=UPI00358EC6A5